MDENDIFDRMRKLCSRREYCTNDILKKINILCEEYGVSADASIIISRLYQEKYVDDARYARAFARDKSMLQGWGEMKIKYDLRRKDIDGDIITSAIAEIDEDRAEKRLYEILRNKYRTLRGDEKEKQIKIFRFAIGRGYKYEQVKKIYDNIRTD